MSGTPRIASPGTPPLIWSSVEEAFRNINQNFNDLYATIQADGSTQVVNFSQLYDDVSPAVNAAYKLGDFEKSWKSLNLSPFLEIDGSNLNGLWLGLAHIVDDGTAVVLPPDSRVGLDLIIDPAKTFWKTFSIDSENFVEAVDFADTLNINSGTAIQIVVDSSAESLTFNNTGVTSLIAGTGTSISSATGNITVTNTGVISLTNGATLPAGLPAGSGISVSSAAGDISVTNTGVIDIQNGFGITVSRDNATGIVTVTNNAPAQVAFRTVRVVGPLVSAGLFEIGSTYIIESTGTTNFIAIGSTSNSPGAVFTSTGAGSGTGTARKTEVNLVADSTQDTLVVEAGYGMVITTTEVSEDTLVISVDQNIDITGSVFANDSSLMVDSIDQKIYADGGFIGDLQGNITGYHTGDMTGSVFADDSTKLVDAVEGLIVGPVVTPSLSIDGTFNFDTTGAFSQLATMQVPSGGSLSINQDTAPVYFNGSGGGKIVTIQDGDITANTIFVPIIDTTDSSEINVVPSLNCNSNLTVGGDIVPSESLGGNLGSPDKQWKSLYVSGSTIFLGGVEISVSGSDLVVGGTVIQGSVGITDIVQDTTPQLGGNLDLNSFTIQGTGTISFTGNLTATNIAGPTGGNITGYTNITGDSGGTISGFTTLTGDSGGTISGFTNITGDSGGTISGFTTLTGDSGGDITQFTNITGDSGGTISQFTNITGDSGGTISQFTNITGDSGGTISQFTNITGDSGGTISQFTNITGDSGGTISGFTTLTGDGGGSISGFGDVTVTTVYAGTIDTTDSSAITIVPKVTFNTDVTIDNELFVGNDITAVRFIGDLVANNVSTVAFTVGKIEETFENKTGATSVVTHDCSSGHIFNHSSISGNFTANFTNLGLEEGKGTNITLILNQGGTAYMTTGVQIGGVAYSIYWQNSVVPNGTINKKDIVTFSIINNAGTYTVFGNASSYGT